ncbi:MAG: Gas vesicle synthesis GvpLGvpF [Herbinix sp.]|jgi:hypothetical protein|nr:Gas vesicle synthesis GvpLGvpF [Herbinix sp.]
MSAQGKYIYCFIKEKDLSNFGSSTFTNVISPVYTIPVKEISAVVSNTDIYEFDPTRKNVLNHQRIITKVMEKYTVVPVAFGTVANNKKAIENIIESNYDQFLEQIEFLTNKAEVGLKVIWEDSYFNEDIEDDEIRRLKGKVSGKDEEEVLLDKIELGKLVQAAMEEKIEKYTKEIYDPLSKLAVRSKRKESVPIKTVFNASFLVNNVESDIFDKEVERLSELFQNKLKFSYIGPWPPYNFVDLRINLNDDNEE